MYRVQGLGCLRSMYATKFGLRFRTLWPNWLVVGYGRGLGGHDMYVRFLKHVSLERTEIINPESVGNYTRNLKPRSPKPPNP